MRSFRLLSFSLVAITATSAAIISCSSSNSTTTKTVDAPVTSHNDAPKVFMDAPVSTVNSLGVSCETVDCPTGYTCLSAGSAAGTPAFCSQTCGGGSDTTTCAKNYTGPGLPACVFAVGSAATAATNCGVICEAPAADCPSATCNETCATGGTCDTMLGSGSGSNTVKACD